MTDSHRSGTLTDHDDILTAPVFPAASASKSSEAPMPHIHLVSLKLRNFKGIAGLDLDLDESLTLLAGVNGVGKTSVMQALLAAVTHSWVWKSPGSYPLIAFPGSVVRAATSGTEVVLGMRITQSDRVASLCSVEFTVDDELPKLDITDRKRLQKFLDNLPGPLPLVVYYEQNRGVSPNSSGRRVTVSSKRNRFSSLDTTVSSPSEFKLWFFEKEGDEGREALRRQNLKYEDPELATIRGLLPRLDGFTAIRSRKPPDSEERILLLEKEGMEIDFDSLSGGERAFILLAADLCRRLMLESPNTPVAEVPGIVCIDEIELHLHPAWQRRILKTLMEMFPACQFVVSTHSPQVIAGVEARHVRLLVPGENGVRRVSQPLASKGHDSNYVLRGVLDTPERDDHVSQLLAKFDDLADDRNFDKAQRMLDELEQAVEGQSSAVAIRQAKLNRLRRTVK